MQDWLDGKPVAAAPYRYRFDPREVIAARPQAVLLVAFWMWFSSLYCLLVGFEGIVPAGSRRGSGGLNAWSLVMVGFGVWYLLLGRGLLSGRYWMLWAGVVTSLYNVGLFTFYLYRMAMAPAGAVGPYSSSLFTAIVVCWLASLVALLRRRTRDWFRLASRLRAEHKQADSPT
ncbi:hypothetical protein [Tautonia plasticadhaerens]|uniref:hypothetical protein n=1 Tax=Tautonia plasticadhaerens TaxID=2527974 RepID=UPI001E29FC7A|nr:hypothetical protein [Tautonia plasticadhaerens]